MPIFAPYKPNNMKNTLKTVDEVKGAVAALIASHEFFYYKINPEYGVHFTVIDQDVHWKIRFEWFYACKHGELGSCTWLQSSDSFIWLKGEPYENLIYSIERVLDMITADEIEIITYKG